MPKYVKGETFTVSNADYIHKWRKLTLSHYGFDTERVRGTAEWKFTIIAEPEQHLDEIFCVAPRGYTHNNAKGKGKRK